MDQTRSLTALAPFLALSKSATSPRAAADLVTQATSAQGTYVFAELLAQPNITALKSDSQYRSYHRLLEIFAWGTWYTYKETPDLPSLSDTQTLKLRLLSLLSFAAEKDGDLGYASLCKRLDLSSAVDLEHLVTTAIYYNLLTATLNPAEQTVLIASVAPLRDLAPGSLETILADLAAWSGRCDSVVADLEGEITRVKSDAAKRAAREAKAEKQVKAAVEHGDKSAVGGTGGTSGSVEAGIRGSRNAAKRETADNEYEDDEDPMDVDGQPNGSKKRMASFTGRLKGS